MGSSRNPIYAGAQDLCPRQYKNGSAEKFALTSVMDAVSTFLNATISGHL